MPKRAYVALPSKLTPEVEGIAAALEMNVNEFGVRCLEGCVAAIKADMPTMIPIVRHARRILRRELSAGDRLLLAALEKAIPDLPKDGGRFRELLIEETNAIEGDLTNDRLKQAYASTMARWRDEEGLMREAETKLAKAKSRRSTAKSRA